MKQKAQIDLLETYASQSRVRMENGKPAKLFWNSTGGELNETFARSETNYQICVFQVDSTQADIHMRHTAIRAVSILANRAN